MSLLFASLFILQVVWHLQKACLAKSIKVPQYLSISVSFKSTSRRTLQTLSTPHLCIYASIFSRSFVMRLPYQCSLSFSSRLKLFLFCKCNGNWSTTYIGVYLPNFSARIVSSFTASPANPSTPSLSLSTAIASPVCICSYTL